MEKINNIEKKRNGENNEIKEKEGIKDEINENNENKDNSESKVERIGQNEKELLLKIIKDKLIKRLEYLENRNIKENNSLQMTNKNVKKIKFIYI